MNKWIFLSVLVIFFLVLAIPINSLTKEKLEVHLIKNIDDVPLKIREKYPDVFYTPTCLAECNIPLLFKWSESDITIARSELKYYKEKITGLDSMNDIQLLYLRNNTVIKEKWIPSISCSFNGTAENCIDNGKHENYLDWELEFVNVPSTISIKADEWYIINIKGNKKASLGEFAVDLIPEIKGIKFPEFAWWNSSFDYKKQININSSVATDLTNFPINLTVDTSTLIGAGKMQSNCYDIRFVDSTETTELDYHFENRSSASYGCNNAGSIIWVEIPTLASANTTYIYMYYGYASAENGEDMIGTYGSYDQAFHFAEVTAGSATIDVVGNANGTATGGNPPYNSSGKFGHGISFDGSTAYYIENNRNNLQDTTITVSAWILTDNVGCHGVHGNDGHILYYGLNATHVQATYNSGGSYCQKAATMTANIFHHVAVVYSSTKTEIFIDGSSIGYCTHSAETGVAKETYIGTNGQWTSCKWDGIIDEWRVRDESATSDWINMEYVSGVSNLISWGSEVTAGNPPTWSNNASSTPATYSPSTTSNFQVMWNDDIDTNGYNVSIFGTNCTGSWTNFTTSRTGNYSYVNMTLPSCNNAGWEFYANDSNNNWNKTNTWFFTINQVSSSCSLSLDPSSPITYGTQHKAVCSCNNPEGTTKIYRNTTDVTAYNNTNVLLGAGSYGYVCNVTNTQNYTSATDSDNMVINQATNPVHIWFNDVLDTNITFTSETVVLTNISCAGSNVTPYRSNTTESDFGSGFSDWVFINATYGWTNTSVYPRSNGEHVIFKGNCTGNANYSTNATGLTRKYTYISALTINVLDELTSADLTFNITLANSTYEITEYNTNLFVSNGTNTPYGNVTILYDSDGYPERVSYVNNLTDASQETITLYLLSSSDGVYVTFLVWSDTNPAGESNATVIAEKLIGSNITQVDARISDDEGKGYLFLYPYSIHTITANDQDGYNTIMQNYYPSPSFILKLHIEDQAIGVNVTWLFTDVNYSLSPADTYLRPNINNNITTFCYNISDANSEVEWFALNVSYWNGSSLYFYNDTTAAGGSICVNLNYTLLSGSIVVQTYLKKIGYDLFSFDRIYTIWSSHSAIPDAIEYLAATGLGDVIEGIIALFASYGIALVVARYVKTGSGIIFLGILTIFTLYGWFNIGFLIGLWLMETGILMFREIP